MPFFHPQADSAAAAAAWHDLEPRLRDALVLKPVARIDQMATELGLPLRCAANAVAPPAVIAEPASRPPWRPGRLGAAAALAGAVAVAVAAWAGGREAGRWEAGVLAAWQDGRFADAAAAMQAGRAAWNPLLARRAAVLADSIDAVPDPAGVALEVRWLTGRPGDPRRPALDGAVAGPVVAAVTGPEAALPAPPFEACGLALAVAAGAVAVARA